MTNVWSKMILKTSFWSYYIPFTVLLFNY